MPGIAASFSRNTSAPSSGFANPVLRFRSAPPNWGSRPVILTDRDHDPQLGAGWVTVRSQELVPSPAETQHFEFWRTVPGPPGPRPSPVVLCGWPRMRGGPCGWGGGAHHPRMSQTHAGQSRRGLDPMIGICDLAQVIGVSVATIHYWRGPTDRCLRQHPTANGSVTRTLPPDSLRIRA
jgi:hypothetical protein